VSIFMTFVVAGTTVGSVYALVAVGLVLTYRTSGVLNFAQGALALIAVEAYIFFTANLKLSWQVGAALSVFGVGCLLGLLLEPLGRILGTVSSTKQVVATVGLLIAIQSAVGLIGPKVGGAHPRYLRPPLPSETVVIARVHIGVDQIIIVAVSLVVLLALWAFLRATRMGLAMRAVSFNADLLSMSGTDPHRVRRGAWIIGAVFACLSGVLLALSPSFGASPDTVNEVVLPSFAGAAVAGFTSLPLAYAGGLIVGIISSLLTWYVRVTWLAGLSSATPFIVLLLAVVFLSWRSSGRSDVRVRVRTRPRRSPAPRWSGLTAAGIVGLFALSVPSWAGLELGIYTNTLIFVILFLSLGLLLKTADMVSLCQLAFAAVGATSFARLSAGLHFPWLVALAIAMLLSGATGALVALPALRASGAYLGLVTVAFGFILEYVVYASSLMFGATVGSLTAPRPDFASSDESYYYLVAGLLVLAAVSVYAITRSRLGRLVRGLADSPLALESQGASTAVTRLLIFVVSASMAGMAGALLSSLDRFVEPSFYSADASLTLVAVLFVLRLDDPWYAVVAAVVYFFLPEKLPWAQSQTWVSLVFGVLAVYTVVAGATDRHTLLRRLAPAGLSPNGFAPQGLSGPADLVLEDSPPGPDRAEVRVAPAAPPATPSPNTGLEIDDVTVRFGGLVALDRVSLTVAPRAVTGLIGPNGAGKTTLLNVCSGLVRPAHGRVVLDGHEITGHGTATRARRGLGRTFQQPELFESLCVRDAVALGREAALAGANGLHHVVGRSQAGPDESPEVEEALAICGLTGLEDRIVSGLSTAERRLVEVATCLSWPFTTLLLDEPTAGLDRGESARFCEVVQSVVSSRDVAVLLVEHDVSVVVSVCSSVAVLDFGRLIVEGSPHDVMASDLVRAAYLGSSPEGRH
jgi:ABC-type branched-subunit amino acid transport system ATPase component/branched-subunit amino acid ABC-type transport system permease component